MSPLESEKSNLSKVAKSVKNAMDELYPALRAEQKSMMEEQYGTLDETAPGNSIIKLANKIVKMRQSGEDGPDLEAKKIDFNIQVAQAVSEAKITDPQNKAISENFVRKLRNVIAPQQA